ncbi:ribose-phosphate pyrophosphokinase-like isoform X1 [Salmo salar]|uniref:Ribose-phosphate pyrophosphokinase-like isoform X1 n=1 Tax=Salmo salar TaxID=8030 RepID=A0ABM3E9Z9_SALSA|nr:ribose-phosphate pyrophosphokinase-like isoform X1 [Salmo salar]XP_045567873.1 ribose-phosphate pyrophosphokinase-like isoform X1 [Salmo salar]
MQDDIIDDAVGFVAAAEMLRERGAGTIIAVATHAILSADAPRILQESVISQRGEEDVKLKNMGSWPSVLSPPPLSAPLATASNRSVASPERRGERETAKSTGQERAGETTP